MEDLLKCIGVGNLVQVSPQRNYGSQDSLGGIAHVIPVDFEKGEMNVKYVVEKWTEKSVRFNRVTSKAIGTITTPSTTASRPSSSVTNTSATSSTGSKISNQQSEHKASENASKSVYSKIVIDSMFWKSVK